MHHVLLLEDDAPLRASLLRSLQDSGELSLSGVGSLRDAVKAIDSHTPSLLVSDLDLPDGTGLDLLPELAARGLRLPIIFITAHHARFSAELPTSSNIDVLQKPFAPEKLKTIVRQRLLEAVVHDPAFAVSDYLQLAGMAKRSVRLAVHQNQQKIGEIIVQDGEPRWAADSAGEGEGAFRRLALLPRAEVTCQALTAPLPQSNLNGSLEHLLIDAARSADEALRAPRASTRPTAPPPLSRPPVPPPPPVRAQRPPLPPRPGDVRSRPAEVPNVPVASTVGAPSQEKTVTISKPKVPAQQLLALDPSLKAAARADRHGSVVEVAGEIDAETACAVATMASREVAEAAAELGFGRPQAWQLSLSGATWYVANGRDELLVCQGGVNKNPGALLKKLAKSCGAGT